MTANRRQRKREKNNGFNKENINFSRASRLFFLILYISLPSLYDYDVKMPSHVLQRMYTSDVEISFLFLNVDLLLRDSALGGFT